MKNLTLIIHAKNEAESLPKFLDQLKYLNSKILVILQTEYLVKRKFIRDLNNFEILNKKKKEYVNVIINSLLILCRIFNFIGKK